MASSVVQVNIRNIAVGGAGVGEVHAQTNGKDDLLGIAAFVPFSIPGEQVSAHVTLKKKQYIETQLLQVEKESPLRVVAPCKYFSTCGGCELQHISYDGQLELKHRMIEGALRSGRVPQPVIDTLLPVIPGDAFGYRRRVTLHIDASGSVGFYRPNSRAVVAIQSCPISVPLIEESLKDIQVFGREVRGKVSSIVLEADESTVVCVLKTPYALGDADVQQVLSIAKKVFKNVKIVASDKEVGGFGKQILEMPLAERGAFSLQVPAGSFSQVNWKINQQLVERVVQYAEATAGKAVLDLYAGAGNFSLPLARTGAKVTAVECDERLVGFGRQNAFRLGLDSRLDFFEGSVEAFLKSKKPQRSFDVLVADPPRSGLGNLASELPVANRFLLVSCHLPSFVRDIKTLSQSGWQVKVLQPYDMFAQTSYVEILSLLERA